MKLFRLLFANILLCCLISSFASYSQNTLTDAALNNDWSTVEQLVEKGASIDEQNDTFLYAVAAGKKELVEKLSKNGANPNFKTSKDQYTPLYVASIKGNNDIITMLLDNGAISTLNFQLPNTGWTPLHVAIIRNKPQTVELLLKKGADPSIKGRDPKSNEMVDAITLAQAYNRPEIVNIIKKYANQ